jgi:hypothetical protein
VGGTLVENYNAGVRATTGKIILTIQDDLHCPLHWDAQIEAALTGKLEAPAALQIRDGYRTDDLLITFCVTRPTLDLFGLRRAKHRVSRLPRRFLRYRVQYARLVQQHGILVPSQIGLASHEHPAWNPAVPIRRYLRHGELERSLQARRRHLYRRNPDLVPQADTTPSA